MQNDEQHAVTVTKLRLWASGIAIAAALVQLIRAIWG